MDVAEIMYQHTVGRQGAMQHEMNPSPGKPIFYAAHVVEIPRILQRFDIADHAEAQIPPQLGKVRMIERALRFRHLKVFSQTFIQPQGNHRQVRVQQCVGAFVADVDRQIGLPIGVDAALATTLHVERSAIGHPRI